MLTNMDRSFFYKTAGGVKPRITQIAKQKGKCSWQMFQTAENSERVKPFRS